METKLNDRLRNFIYKDFILPSPNFEGLEGNVIKKFVYNETGDNYDYFKDVVSLVISMLGDRTGVSFDTHIAAPNDTAKGHYFERANKISCEENFLKTVPLAYSTIVLSHESYHKHQAEVNKQAKMLGPYQHRYTPSYDRRILPLLETTNNKMFYHINRAEKQAFIFDGQFTNSFLSKAQDLATFMKDTEKQAWVGEQQEFAKDITDVEKAAIEANESLFISKHMQRFYQEADKSFKSFIPFFLDYQTHSSDDIRREFPKVISKLNATFENSKGNLDEATYAMTMLLGVLPKKENVETFIDALTTSRIDCGYTAIQGIVVNRVPITKNDFTRLALSSNNENAELPSLFTPRYLDMVDERVWAKNLVLTVGVQDAKQIIEQFKASGDMPNTDFYDVDRYVSSFSQKPLINIDGTPFYNCRDLLQFVSARDSSKYARFNNNALYYDTCGVFSKNLANIIGHFNNPSAENEDFVRALNGFVANPKALMFPETEERSEIGTVFSETVSEKVAEYIDVVRQQQTENDSQATSYTATLPNGTPYREVYNSNLEYLSDCLMKLSQSLKVFAEVISQIDIEDMIEKLCVSESSSVWQDKEAPLGNEKQNMPTQDEIGRPSIDTRIKKGDKFAPALTKEEIFAMFNGTDLRVQFESSETSDYISIENNETGSLDLLGQQESCDNETELIDYQSQDLETPDTSSTEFNQDIKSSNDILTPQQINPVLNQADLLNQGFSLPADNTPEL